MERRKFLSLSMATAITLPMGLMATDYRAEKPKAWTAQNVDTAIKALYGEIKPLEKGINLTIPKIASDGAAIPVKIKSDLDLKSLSVFQDVNPEATVASYSIGEGAIIEYFLKIKMAKSGSIVVIGEGRDGTFYKASHALKTSPGCEG